jgi:hypothetical protein
MNDKSGSECDTNISAEMPQNVIWIMIMNVRKNYWFDIQLVGHRKRNNFFFVQHQDLESILRESVINKIP